MKRVFMLLIAVGGLAVLAGCGQARTLPASEAQSFAASVEPVVRNMLVGLSNNDYAMHTRDFDDSLRSLISEASFPAAYDEVIGGVGAYHSHRLVSVMRQANQVIVIYTAVFERDPQVTVQVTFWQDDPAHRIAGLWFDSPLLRSR